MATRTVLANGAAASVHFRQAILAGVAVVLLAVIGVLAVSLAMDGIGARDRGPSTPHVPFPAVIGAPFAR